MPRTLKIVILALVVLAGLAFHLRNDQLVTLDLYLGTWDLWFSLWLIIAVTLGALLGCAALVPGILKLRREKARLAKRVRAHEEELDNLRALPFKDPP